MKECGAKTRNGSPCKRAGLENGRCRLHGGVTPSGIASPQFKDGRYSKVLPARLAVRYAQGQNDPRLLELRDEVSLVDARLGELLQHIDTLGDPVSWAAAAGFWHEAKTESDPIKKVRAEHALDALLDRAVDQYAAWAGVSQAIEQRRRLVESESKRLIQAEQMIPAEQAMALIGAFIGIIRSYIVDRDILNNIQTDVARLLDRPDDQGFVIKQ